MLPTWILSLEGKDDSREPRRHVLPAPRQVLPIDRERRNDTLCTRSGHDCGEWNHGVLVDKSCKYSDTLVDYAAYLLHLLSRLGRNDPQ